MDLLGRIVAAIDRRQRRRLGIRDFSDDPRDFFRLVEGEAWRETRLSDGTVLRPGMPVGVLHLAGERFPVLPFPGGGLAWGKRLAASHAHSLRLLAAHAEKPDHDHLKAYGNDLTLPYTQGTLRMLARVGFEVLEPLPHAGLRGRVAHFGTRLWTALLRRAHNPHSTARLRLRDLETRPIWISRRTLLARYGRAPAPSPPPPATPAPR